VWTAEHVVLPDPQTPDSPIPARTPLLDPAVALSYVAAHTRTIRLGTGIIILPQRNPVVLAKELASVDVLSGGRLIFGIGAGYLRGEFEAVGASFADRGERTNEYIEAILALWTQEKPSFEGRFLAFGGIDAQPRPLQKPHPPIVVGGMSPPALRRAARQQSVARPAELGPLEISVTPSGPLDADAVSRFEDLGVDRLVLLALGDSAEDLIAFVEKMANAFLRAR
jgi:probable F420-dependent oxidoreductase